jgi:hypothetical protein
MFLGAEVADPEPELAVVAGQLDAELVPSSVHLGDRPRAQVAVEVLVGFGPGHEEAP